MGYAFINFVETKVLERFHYDFQGKKWPHFNSEKVIFKYIYKSRFVN